MYRRLLLSIVLLLSSMCVDAQQDTVGRHYDIDDVVVSAKQQLISTLDESGNVSISMDALKSMPHFGGAVDVVKLLQYTPGVTATQEGNTALYVRGGDAGQSSVLINGAPLYAPSHLLGFFSVLNSAHLSGLTLYKSGIPAMYGSSTASITDIRTHAYVPEKFRAEANVGLIESDVALQIPATERFAIFLSARHSYLALISKLLHINHTDMGYEFGDYGVGVVGDLGRVGRLSLNTHFNHDCITALVNTYNSSGHLKWWNGLGTVTLDSDISPRVSMKNMLYSSVYDNLLNISITERKYDVNAGVETYGAKSVTSVDFDAVDISAGVSYEYRKVNPQSIKDRSYSVDINDVIEHTSEAALFADARWRIHPHLTLDAGARLSLYRNDRWWCNAEPRIMLSIPVSSTLRFWASYNMMAQYLHLVPQSNMSFATDFYISSSESTPPQYSHNFSLGYNQSAFNDRLRWTMELYYRRMSNVIEYEASILDVLMGSTNHQAQLFVGNGESYGVESSIAYADRYFDVQLNYTLSKSLRQFDEINNGLPFRAHSDRRHNLSMLASWKPSERWTFSATFVYATGAPYTETKSVYIGANGILREYGPYNGGKLPDLHHLDLSATYWFKSKKFEYSGINISIYNVYARKNPIMLSWSVSVDKENVIHLQERKHTIYTILPSISWTFRF